MLDYCDKCGWVWERSTKHERDGTCGKCEICGNALKPVPDNYFKNPEFKYLLSKEMKQKLIEDLVKTSPNFDQYYFDNALNIKGQQDSAYRAKIEHGKAVLAGKDKGNKFGISCPYCQSTNTKKISGLSKAVNVGLFGIFALGKTTKQWHCNNCKSDF